MDKFVSVKGTKENVELMPWLVFFFFFRITTNKFSKNPTRVNRFSTLGSAFGIILLFVWLSWHDTCWYHNDSWQQLFLFEKTLPFNLDQKHLSCCRQWISYNQTRPVAVPVLGWKNLEGQRLDLSLWALLVSFWGGGSVRG